jgi:hypothetical protein
MAISARLSRILHRQLGDEAGEDLINWMSQVEANRSELRDTMDGYIALTNSRFAEHEARMDARFAAVDARMAELKGEVMAAIQKTRADVILWSFVFWCATMLVVIAPRLLG